MGGHVRSSRDEPVLDRDRLFGGGGPTPASSESAYHFRYHGLVLLIEIGGRYVLVPADWERGQGTAIVLPKDAGGAMRLEFATSDDYQPSPTC